MLYASSYMEMQLPIFNSVRIVQVGINSLVCQNQNVYTLRNSKKDQDVFRFTHAKAAIYLHPNIKDVAIMLLDKLGVSRLVANILAFVIDK
jgi:hypothetical protein